MFKGPVSVSELELKTILAEEATAEPRRMYVSLNQQEKGEIAKAVG